MHILVIATMSAGHILAQARPHDVVHLTSIYIIYDEIFNNYNVTLDEQIIALV